VVVGGGPGHCAGCKGGGQVLTDVDVKAVRAGTQEGGGQRVAVPILHLHRM
jgi:hypothetical protein